MKLSPFLSLFPPRQAPSGVPWRERLPGEAPRESLPAHVALWDVDDDNHRDAGGRNPQRGKRRGAHDAPDGPTDRGSVPPPTDTYEEEREAFLFDLYPLHDGMVLWFLLPDGRRLRLRDTFEPLIFLRGNRGALDRLLADLATPPAGTPPVAPPHAGAARRHQSPHHTSAPPRHSRAHHRSGGDTGGSGPLRGFRYIGTQRRHDFWTGDAHDVEAIAVTELDIYFNNLRTLYRAHPGLSYYNAEILPAQHYCYERDIFPGARCRVRFAGERLLGLKTTDDAWDVEWADLPLRIATLTADDAWLHPTPRIGALHYTTGDRTVTIDTGDPEDFVAGLNEQLRTDDPDVIITRGGDSLLLPALFGLARRARVTPMLDREPNVRRTLRAAGRSFISYGQVLFHEPDYPLFGRWHLDERASFWMASMGLDGLLEVARIGKIPVQRIARRSIGTGLSSIQFDRVYRSGGMIPWKKTQPEAWKSAVQLVKSDRGGLCFQPRCGVYEDVVEIDFVSMFPTLMYHYNVSPDTLLCDCCNERSVPELGYTICQKREGQISGALRPIVEKRIEQKRLRAEARARDDDDGYRRWDARQSALKWLLVCCFGYLGYRNARFGRIEAHEATTAISREMLLRSKELVEEHGWDVLHANVDCFWMQHPGTTQAMIDDICAKIEDATRLPIAIEGRYTWLVFLPSRVDPRVPVPTRYFGRFDDGTLKYRGIELRRGDACPLQQNMQRALLDELAKTESLAEARSRARELVDLVDDWLARLRGGEFPLTDLVFGRRLSKEPDAYRATTMTSTAALQLKKAGIELHAGQMVHYLVTDDSQPMAWDRIVAARLIGADTVCDLDYYAAKLVDAAGTILEGFLGEGEELPQRAQIPKTKRASATRQIGSVHKQRNRATSKDRPVPLTLF